MKHSGRIAGFLLALLIGGLFALSLLRVSPLRKADGIQMAQKALADPDGLKLARRAGELLDGDASLAEPLSRAFLAKDKPSLALALLTPVTEHENGRNDPLAWGALARAARAAKDDALAERADAEAKKFGEAALGEKKVAGRLKNAGLYFAATDLGNEPKKAFAVLRAALALSPKDAELLNALGYTLADRGATPAELNEAVELTLRAVKLTLGNPMTLDSYGWALVKQGKNLGGAKRALQEAVDLASDEAELRYHLGVACAKLGESDAARIELGRALQIEPGHKEARSALDALKVKP